MGKSELPNGHGPNGVRTESPALPFGKGISLSSISGPTYLTAQTLVQQVAYSLSDRIFAYSPETFELDAGAHLWQSNQEKNAYGEVTDVRSLDTRVGAGAMALGYMFYPDFDLSKKDRPQTIIASSASLRYLRSSLDELSLLYEASRPVSLQVAAVDYAPETHAGLITDYAASLTLAEELGYGLLVSKSAYEIQHMALLSTLLSNIIPTMHTYDGINLARETTRVVDILNTAGLKREYETVLAAVQEDFKSKRLTPEGKLSKLLNHFNSELGTEYRSFEYHGHKSPSTVAVVFGSVESSLGAQVADALAAQDIPVGILSVRVYRPFAEDDFIAALPATVQRVLVLGQVKDLGSVADASVASALYSDVLAAVTFRAMTTGSEPQIFDVKYARETVWTVAKMETLLRPAVKAGEEAPIALSLIGVDTKQYTFWDADDSASANAATMIGQLLSANSSLNVTVRTGHDNLAHGGVIRTDVRCSSKSIEAAYSVTQADVVVVGKDDLLQNFNIVNSIKDNGILMLKYADWKDDTAEKMLKTTVRKAIAAKKLELYVIDPSVSQSVVDDVELEQYLVQLAFFRVAQPSVYETGLKTLQAGGDVLQALTKDVDAALKKVEVPEAWATVEPEANETFGPSFVQSDINANSFEPYHKVEDEEASLLRSWVTAAKGLAFKEAYGTASALRPDLPVKTAVVTVQERRRLTPTTYDRNIFHIEFDLGDSGLKYDIGEALGIHAENDPKEVEAFIQWYGLSHDDIVEVPSRDDVHLLETRTVYQALTQNIDIFGRPPKRFYEALSEFATDEEDKKNLLLLGTGGNQESVLEFKRRAEVDTITYADILQEFTSAKPSFHELIHLVSPMKRREYSIASSQKVTPNSVSLLIVTVNWVDPKGRDRFGQATRYLNALRVGAPVTVSVKPSVMKLPPKSTQPIIMAGLGTGLAPFRAFVQERAWQKQQGMEIGDVFLYMGARHQREEYLYGEEWEAYQAAGIITLLGRAFSRDQPKKIYIQDRMRQTLDDIRRAYLREEGAFYLCGPTWPVPDVTSVLEEAVVAEGNAQGKKRDGPKEIEKLKDELRYVLEVY